MKAPTNAPLPFVIETGIELPAITRSAGRAASPYATTMAALKLSADPRKREAFFIPATAPDTITDADERAKAVKEDGRKIANRISGIARRMAKADTTVAFAIRTMFKVPNDPASGLGVRVYRVAPEPKVAPVA